MTTSIWQLESQRGTLKLPELCASVDLGHPARGLHNLQVGNRMLKDCHVLGIRWGGDATEPARKAIETYVRGVDLIATYAEAQECPYAPQIYWRAIRDASPAKIPSQVELWASVQTHLLDAQPTMRATSRLPAGEVLQLIDAQRGSFAPRSVGNGEQRLQAFEGAACLLLRPQGSDVSYVEMVHPLDFTEDRLSLAADRDGVLLTHMLIDRRMEKGVIVRVRVRGSFVPRENDRALAAKLYAEFAESALPLSA